MASTAAPGARGRLPFLLLLLPLLPSPARGNEGGAAGSCQCRRVAKPPPFPDKVESCDTCGGFTRFNFPNRRVCGLPEDPWVSQLKNSHCGKGRPGEGAGRVDASRGHRPPTPTPSRVAPTPTPPSSARVSPDRSRGTPGAAEPGMGVASVPTRAGSGPGPSAEAAAREADKAPPEEREATRPPAPDTTTPNIITVVCVALAVGAAVLAFGWRRQRRRGQAGQGPRAPLGGEEGGSLCLAGENT